VTVCVTDQGGGTFDKVFKITVTDVNEAPTMLSLLPNAPLSISIGDYVQFGMYNNAPILWRAIHKDPTTGNPILLADRILTMKAFDSKGFFHIGDSNRVNNGSNFYKNSNIRQWLNNSSPNSGADTIDWIQNDPNATNVNNGQNPYNTEKGFLANGNFTSTERGLIEPYTHKVLLADIDKANKDGGTWIHQPYDDLANVVQNYDTTAYFQNVTDKIFMLSVKQLKEWVYDNSGVLGTSYHMAKPTAEAVTQSTLTDASLNSDENWVYWLNTPRTDFYSYLVRYVTSQGLVQSYNARHGIFGVRPALQLNLSSAMFSSGVGTSTNPFVIGDNPIPGTIAENAGTNAVVGRLSATDGDAGDTETFTLVSGAGDTDNASFNISGTSLHANTSFDFETKAS
jgi:hypothetical protein